MMTWRMGVAATGPAPTPSGGSHRSVAESRSGPPRVTRAPLPLRLISETASVIRTTAISTLPRRLPRTESIVIEELSQQAHALLPAVSFVGSAASVGVTGYFWLVKMNRERPRLVVEAVDHLSYVDLGSNTEDERRLSFRLGLVVVNESTLPSSVLSATVRVMPRLLGTWQEVEGVHPTRGSTLPLNLPPLQSGLLTIKWEMGFPMRNEAEDLDSPDRIVEAYLERHWKLPDRVSVEVRGVRGRSFAAEVPLRGSRMTSTVRSYLELQQSNT